MGFGNGESNHGASLRSNRDSSHSPDSTGVNFPGPAVLRAANEALIEQTKLLNLIVTSMGDGLLVVDRDGAALLSNPAVRRMLGLKENEDVPKKLFERLRIFSGR